MGDILGTIVDFFQNIGTVIDNLGDLKTQIDQIEFSSTSTISQFFGNMRFLVGDVNYVMIIAILQIGGLFLLYKLATTIYREIRKII